MRTLFIFLLWSWACCASISSAQDYYFTTIAGQPGVSGSSDGTNAQALFNRPSELTLDGSGALYVSDTLNNTIRRITPVGGEWVVTTIAGMPGIAGSTDQTNGAAQFYRPNGLAFDEMGNLFAADHNNHIVRRITRYGMDYVVSTIAGLAGVYGTADGTNSEARFRIPTGLAVDASGRVFVVDTANFTIRMATRSGSN